MFLSTDPATQVGLFALLPQVVDAVKVPVIATGGIADARTMAAALTLGAAAVQIGTALLFCPEAKNNAAAPGTRTISPLMQISFEDATPWMRAARLTACPK